MVVCMAGYFNGLAWLQGWLVGRSAAWSNIVEFNDGRLLVLLLLI